jgi:6-pyruvoyltetrahydropterin/6-carboxytetrahydropterin synthase
MDGGGDKPILSQEYDLMRARIIKDFRFEGEVNPAIGWVYDHKCISQAMKPLLEMMDHSYLNDLEGLESPTIEIMAAWFWRKLEKDLPGLCEIVIYETPTARCSFRGEF